MAFYRGSTFWDSVVGGFFSAIPFLFFLLSISLSQFTRRFPRVDRSFRTARDRELPGELPTNPLLSREVENLASRRRAVRRDATQRDVLLFSFARQEIARFPELDGQPLGYLASSLGWRGGVGRTGRVQLCRPLQRTSASVYKKKLVSD